MTDDDLIGYALDLLDADAEAAVAARLAADPDAAARLERIRSTFDPLEADRDDPLPPDALAARTIARVAADLVEHGAPQPEHLEEVVAEAIPLNATYPMTDRPEPRAVGGRFRADLVVAAGIGLIAVGMVLSFVSRTRYQSEVAACQNNLLTLHQGLTGYADANGGQFPQIGPEPYPTAESFVSVLRDAGQCPAGFHPTCPAAVASDTARPATLPVTYTYALGHQSPQGLLGPRRSEEPGQESELLPISADYPAASVALGYGPTSGHRNGHNVLYAGGHVRFATTATVGVNGDDIYRNHHFRVAAGVDRSDSVLGRAGDHP